MANGKDAAIYAMKAAELGPSGDGAGAEPALRELTRRDHPVLSGGHARNPLIDEKFPHTGNKSSSGRISPPAIGFRRG